MFHISGSHGSHETVGYLLFVSFYSLKTADTHFKRLSTHKTKVLRLYRLIFKRKIHLDKTQAHINRCENFLRLSR